MMMKSFHIHININSILFMALLLPQTIIAQQKQVFRFGLQVTYNMSYQKDSNDVQSVRKLPMELLVNDSVSLFRSIKKARKDSVDYYSEKEPNMISAPGPVSKFEYQIVKKKGAVITYDPIFGMGPDLKELMIGVYHEDPDFLPWQITADTLTKAGFLCQKAMLDFGGRHWTAWFAPEIPMSDGPYKFCGLPGLIISIGDTKGYWRFELVELKKVEREVAINFQDWYRLKQFSKKDFFMERKKYESNVFALFEAAGLNFKDKREIVRKAINERILKDNNWIELYP